MKSNETNSGILFTDKITDYDALRDDYMEYCKDADVEPQPDGEYVFWSETSDLCWREFKDVLDKLTQSRDYFLLRGTAQRWNGYRKCGYLGTLNEIIHKLLIDCDSYVTFKLEDGAINVELSHHDGTNNYTIYPLNKRATATIDAFGTGFCDYKTDEELHDKLDKPYYFSKLTMDDFVL